MFIFIDREYLPQTIWAFPYFMEPRIVKKLSSFTMLDYRVQVSVC